MNDINTKITTEQEKRLENETSMIIKKSNKTTIIFGSVIALLTFVLLVMASVLALSGGDMSYTSEIGSEDVIQDTSYVESSSEIQYESDTTFSEEKNEEPIQVEWNLILISRYSPVPEDFKTELSEVENGHFVDYRVVEPLKDMLASAREAGIMPRITSSYRPAEQQLSELQEYIDRYLAEGYSQEEAEAEARKWVAAPGYSEHETGLAVDISTANWEKQPANIVWDWLAENCWKYGFILRYSEHCNEVTGASVEPWHFRYVGIDAAKEIYESEMCLEEYVRSKQLR